MHDKTVACLAGDGVGPELMAAATRALDRVAELHQLRARRSPSAVRGRGRHALRPSAARRRREPATAKSTRSSSPRRTSRRSTASRPTCSSRGASRASSCDAARRPRRRRPGRRMGERDRDRARVLVRRVAARPHRLRRRLAPTGARVVEPSARAGAGSRSSRRRSARCSSGCATTRRRSTWSSPRRISSTRSSTPPRIRRLARVGRARVAARTKAPACSRPAVRARDDVAGFGVVDPMGMLLTDVADARRRA